MTTADPLYKGLENLDGCPARPGYGTSGKAINVQANMFPVTLTGVKSTNQYDVEINPLVKGKDDKNPRPLLQKVWDQAVYEAQGEVKAALAAGAYDQQKSLYTPNGLPSKAASSRSSSVLLKTVSFPQTTSDDGRLSSSLPTTPRSARRSRQDSGGDKQATKYDDAMLRGIGAVNVLFKQDLAQKYHMAGAAGRKFFSEHNSSLLPSGGVLYQGFQQSYRYTSSGTGALQLDTAYSAFFQPGLLVEVAPRILGLDGAPGGGRGGARGGRGGPRGGFGGAPGPARPLQELTPINVHRLNDLLRGAKFTVTHRKTERIFSVIKLTTQPAENLKFTLNGKDGKPDRTVSVPQYFSEQYNVKVTRPRLPCVQYGKNYIPMEFVKLLPYNSIPFTRQTPDQTAEIIKVTAKPPQQRRDAIMAWRQKLDYDNLPKLKAWGVQVAREMMTVQARVLNAPSVLYGGNKNLRVAFGSWNMKSVKFTKPGKPLESWAVVSLDQRCTIQDCQAFVRTFTGHLSSYGVSVKTTQPPISHANPHAGGNNFGVKNALSTAAKSAYMIAKKDPQLILVILPSRDTALYESIKTCATEELHKPVVTQCLQSARIKSPRRLDQYCGNVAMKVQAKVGGLTHQVDHKIDKTTMMIGADVTHPPVKGGAIPPSIAVSVAAVDGNNNKFKPALRLQSGRVEIIQDFENMITEHIKTFEKNSGAKPQGILFFRDGVSEGQYSHCLNYELRAIKTAASKFPNYKPKVTFVICGKRHAMRFFATSDQDKDRTGNLPPGTVVDKGVTSPALFDFYLQAHAGLRGTAKPTHYVVVADEIGYSADKLQNLVNVLCYSYARATRSVSLVPVAYYADLIAEKARSWIYNDDSETATVPSTSSGSKVQLADFDEYRIAKRFASAPEFENVAWYM
ncbi:hypothetical protein L202_02471 [Cryptococcus amylolentus CBS 6039]|uniref:Piwi domain-containing protein n=2 Tax=Cryptococcus amylolentus CBS 6039 TaxID=1295533 RepID=A0A1E3I0Q1_9TREE|nr:hypothetical protein L202_02471 [Cryptococcus amylolentus CBS 6039]ODN82180.1 hypothetical protein L202_02471 [Cryptococcus amylolentus CBS 6039]